MEPLIQPLIQPLPNKASVASSDQNFAKVPIFYKKAHIVSKKVRLTESCYGYAIWYSDFRASQ